MQKLTAKGLLARKSTEKDIQKAIIDYLRIKHYVVFKHHSTGFAIRDGKAAPFKYGDRGISDIIGCSPEGKFIAVEVKRPGGVVSDEQNTFLDSIRAKGGLAILAFSVDDVIGKI